MSENTARIGEKTVQLSASYKGLHSKMVSREHEMMKVMSAWMGGNGQRPLSPLLVGEPGVGKIASFMNAQSYTAKNSSFFKGTKMSQLKT